MNKYWSKYNFLIETKENKFLLYNTYTNNLLEIEDKNDYDILTQIKQGDTHGVDDDFLQELEDNLILVEDDEIFSQKIKLARLSSRFCSDVMHLTLAPTMACNFACPYCFEENTPQKKTMSENTMEDIVKFIESHKNLRSLNIDWYGGEPLLAFDKIVIFTKKIKDLFINNIKASIVTNGYLLDKDKISQFEALGITKIQVTIDGMELTHNQRRPHKSNDDSFNRIINNLITLYQIYPQITVHIRVNIDKNNASDFFDLNNYLKTMIHNPRLFVYPAFITEYNPCKTTFCMLDRVDQANFALTNGDKYPFEKLYYPIITLSECTARFQNSYVIGPDGEFYKCWCDIGMEEKITGNVKDGITNTNLHTKYMSDADPLYDEKCIKCSYFPICNGGCVFNRFKNQSGSNLDLCAIQKGRLNEFMNLYYEKNVL